jgi:phage repressor protein C with HTH and peptisase S24 domain
VGIGTKIKAAMEAAGKTPGDIAGHLGISESAVSQWFTKDSGPKSDRYKALAAFLNTTVEALLTDLPVQKVQRVDPGGGGDLPVWASAEAGVDGAMILSDAPIDHIARRGQTAAAFAFYAIGDSMSPAYEQGDQLVVDPALPIRAGDDCVFIHNNDDGTMLALVKRIVRVHPDRWRVRQFEPARDFDLPRKTWTRAYRITERRLR